MTTAPRILVIARPDFAPVLPADHQLLNMSVVTPEEAPGLAQELRTRRVPVVVVLDAGSVNVPALLTEFAIKHRDVPVVVASSAGAGPPAQRVRGIWRPAGTQALVTAVRGALQTAVQQARVRTTLDQLNIRLHTSEAVPEAQHHRLLLSGLYLSNILEQASDAIFVTDRRGIVAVWNRAAERLFGLDAGKIVNRGLDALGEPAGPALLTLVDSVSPQKPHRAGEFTSGTGEPRELEVSVSLITDHDGNGIAVSGIARDVTDRNALNRQLQQQAHALALSNRHKEEFLAVLSHELRTPLNTVLGWAHILQQMPHDAGQVHRAAEMITRNATVQWRLVTDLLEYARITAGQLSLQRTVADLAEFTKSALDGIRPELERLNLTLIETYTPGAMVSVDLDRLSQVVLNLLTNAQKFTPAGGRIEVSVTNGHGVAALQVRDTGRGIDPAFLPHIFDPFRQGDASTTRAAQGLGLGLAITRRIVELHGGRISASSEGANSGATFTVTFDLAVGDDSGDRT